MEYPRHSGSGTQTSKTQQRRSRGRSLNVPTYGKMAPEYYMTEYIPDAEMSSQYQNVRPGYATFACRTTQPVVASHKTQAQHSSRLSPQRVEPEEYYEYYYTPPNSPVPGSSNTYPVYEKSSAESTGTRDQLDETMYEDQVDEAEVEEDEVDVYDHVPILPQQERLLRKECYSPREVQCYEHNNTEQRRQRKLLHSNYDMPQPNSSITHSPRPRSPTRQEITEKIMHNRWQQNKPRKLAARSSYDAEGRLYMQSPSPEYDLSDARRYQDAYAHLLKSGTLEKLKDKLPEGYVERVRRRANKELLLLAQGKEDPTKPLKQYVPQSDIAAVEGYFKNLQTMFQDVPNDVELVGTKEVESEGCKARKNVPAQTYYSKYSNK